MDLVFIVIFAVQYTMLLGAALEMSSSPKLAQRWLTQFKNTSIPCYTETEAD